MQSLSRVLANAALIGPSQTRDRLISKIGSPRHATMARLTVLMAPLGYGKTVLAAQWIRSQGDEIIVVVCDRNSLDDALESMSPLQAALHSVVRALEHGSDAVVFRDAFFLLVQAENSPVVVVIDDLDGLAPDHAGRLLKTLLLGEDLPANLWVIALCRLPLRHPVGLLVARNWVRFITQADLDYTDDELGALVSMQSGHSRSPEGSGKAIERWPAAVHLQEPQAKGPWRLHALSDYIFSRIGHVLDSDSHVLLAACVDLPVLFPVLWQDLAETLGMSPASFEDMVSIIPFRREDKDGARLDAEFRACLQSDPSEMAPPRCLRDRVNDLAVAWYARHHRLPDAIQLAVSTGRWDAIRDQVLAECADLGIRDRSGDTLTLLASVPDAILLESEELSFRLIMAMMTAGRTGEAAEWFRRSAPLWNDDDPLVAGRGQLIAASLAFFSTEYERSLAGMDQALAILPPSAHYERMRAASGAEIVASFLLGTSERTAGYAAVATEERQALPPAQYWWLLFALPLRADRIALEGNLLEARAMLEYQVSTLPDGLESISQTLSYWLARIAIEQGDLAGARTRLEAAPASVLHPHWASSAISWASLLHAEGQSDQAIAILYDAIRDAARSSSPLYHKSLRALLAQIWIDTGNLALAGLWVRDERHEDERWPPFVGFPVPLLIVAQYWLANGDWDRAIAVLRSLIAEGGRRGHRAPLVRAYALLAYAHANLENQGPAREAMLHAVRIGSRGGFERSFLLGGLDLRSLLRESPGAPPAAMARQAARRPILTDREVQVLRLVRDGLTNHEIAERLFISPFTVKNHLARVFSVLSVGNRRECVALAQDLGLI